MRLAVAVAALAGCWTDAREPMRPAAPAAIGACTIRDRGAVPMTPVALTLDGERFATVSGASDFELRVEPSGAIATARVETDIVELEGDVDLAKLLVRPRGELTAGWLEVHEAHVRARRGTSVTIEVALPARVSPRKARVDVPCSELTTVDRPDPDRREGQYVVVEKTAPISTVPGGPVVAHLLGGRGDEDEGRSQVRVIERRGDHVRVRIHGAANHVLAWLPATSVSLSPNGFGEGHGVGYGVGGLRAQVSCAHRLAIYVQTPARGEVRVGWLKAGKVASSLTEPTGSTVELSLGQGSLKPYLRGAELARCPR